MLLCGCHGGECTAVTLSLQGAGQGSLPGAALPRTSHTEAVPASPPRPRLPAPAQRPRCLCLCAGAPGAWPGQGWGRSLSFCGAGFCAVTSRPVPSFSGLHAIPPGGRPCVHPPPRSAERPPAAPLEARPLGGAVSRGGQGECEAQVPWGGHAVWAVHPSLGAAQTRWGKDPRGGAAGGRGGVGSGPGGGAAQATSDLLLRCPTGTWRRGASDGRPCPARGSAGGGESLWGPSSVRVMTRKVGAEHGASSGGFSTGCSALAAALPWPVWLRG